VDVLTHAEERREALGERDLVSRLQRQHLAVPPQRRGHLRDSAERQRPRGADRAEVVVDAQRQAARGADAEESSRVVRPVARKTRYTQEVGGEAR
jgi:hypothetical protein